MYTFIRDYQEGLIIIGALGILLWLGWFLFELFIQKQDEKDEHETYAGY